MPLEATVTLPSALAEVARRIAAEQHWTPEKAVLYLIKRGVKAQREAERSISNSYDRFMNAESSDQEKAGDDLIRAIFGPESIA